MPFDGLALSTEQSLISRFQSGDTRAADRLIAAYQPLVRRIAKEYSGTEDALSEGNLGLLEALRRFDPAHRARLGTYAAFWIRARIRDYVCKNRPMASLNETTEDGRERIDLLADDRDDQETVFGEVEEGQVRRDALRRALEGMEEIERAIIVERHLQAAPVPLRTLGARHGLSGERIRQLEVK